MIRVLLLLTALSLSASLLPQPLTVRTASPSADPKTYYQKVVHNYDPEAKCLDGSPGLLYVH